ncbi:MAG: hypothetical protein JSR91_15905 [Proteobacteria bacterium]|nr:hypothetical protein [Pseudomonadota bacterium]
MPAGQGEFHAIRKPAVGKISAGLIAVLVAGGVLVSTADAASDRGPQQSVIETGTAIWGARPILPTLIEAARREAPVPGVDSSRPIMVAYRPAIGR